MTETKTEPKQFNHYQYRNINGSETWTRTTVDWTDSRTGVNNPHWRSQIARGVNATTDMSGIKRTLKASPYSMGGGYFTNANHIPANYRDNLYTGYPNGAFWNLTGASLDAARNQAAGAFHRSLVKKRQAMQAGVFLVELGKTARMVKQSATGMMRLLTRWNDDLRRSKRYTVTRKHRLKAASDKWLEFQFGWRPLASDINSALNVWSSPRRERQRVKGRGESKVVVSQSDGNISSMSPITVRNPHLVINKAQVNFYGAVAAQSRGLGGVADRLGLLPVDFVPTLYELLPWSFLVDYFFNLGDMVNSLCTPDSLVGWSATSQRIETTATYRIVAHQVPSGAVPQRDLVFARTSAGEAEFVRSQVGRSTYPLSQIKVQAELRVPGFGPKWLNMAALAAARQFKYWP